MWPHDNSIIAWGLRRYGYRAEAARICRAMLEAAHLFDGRLPEAFGGYAREETHFPVEYPTACSPQAWATGAPLLFVRALLGLDSDGKHLIIDPALVDPLGQLELLDIPGVWGHMDAFGRARRGRSAARASDGDAGAPRHAGRPLSESPAAIWYPRPTTQPLSACVELGRRRWSWQRR